MKNFFLVALLFVRSCIAFAQNYCVNDSIVREIQFPLTLNDKTEFFYFNNEWIPGAHPGLVSDYSIQKAEVKNDDFGNRSLFLTVSPETLAQIKEEARKTWVNLDTRCEFPGGNGKLKEWIEENIRIPEGFKGSEQVLVKFTVHPDGSISNPAIFQRPSKNEAVNQEAIRLVNALPKFRVKYYIPHLKKSFSFYLPITFKETGSIFIRGRKSSFMDQFPSTEAKIKQLYEVLIFQTVKKTDFNIADICTAGFIRRLKKATDFDSEGYATWLLRSGMQDGDDSPSKIISIVAGANNTVIVNWSDMGHIGSTTFYMIESDSKWKINGATVPEGYNPL